MTLPRPRVKKVKIPTLDAVRRASMRVATKKVTVFFDTECWNLALHFMPNGREKDIHALSEAIQELCEDHCRQAESTTQERK